MPGVADGAGAGPVVKLTVTVRPLGADRVTGTAATDAPPVPSTFARSAMATVGVASSSVIVALTVGVVIVALTAPAMVNARVSSGSSRASALIAIATVLLVSPGR